MKNGKVTNKPLRYFCGCLRLSASLLTSISFDKESDPMEKANIERIDELIASVTQRAERLASYIEIKRRGDVLHQSLHKEGAQREPILVAIGKK